jgi:hypothetical protein
MSCLSYESIPGHLLPDHELSMTAATWCEAESWFSPAGAATWASRGVSWMRAAFAVLAIALAALPISASHAVGRQSVAYPLEPGAWHEAPPGLPVGGTFAAGPFTMRVRLPPGFALPPYRRGADEQLFVLGGAIEVGTVGESGAADRGHGPVSRGAGVSRDAYLSKR